MSDSKGPLFSFMAVYSLVEKQGDGTVETRLRHCYPPAQINREPPKKTGMFLYPDIDRFHPHPPASLAQVPKPTLHSQPTTPSSSSTPAGEDEDPTADISEETNLTLVLTDDSGARQYCFAFRLTHPDHDYPLTLCILTPYGWFGFFREVLKWATKRMKDFGWYAAEELAEALLKQPLPSRGATMEISLTPRPPMQSKYTITRSRRGVGGTDEESEDLAPLLKSLGVNKVIALFAALLIERRVAFVSSNLDTLSRCVHAAAALTWPFLWQHVFIPIVPGDLLSYLDAPMPFLMGVQEYHYSRLKYSVSDTVVVDVDKGAIEMPEDMVADIELLPATHLFGLRSILTSALQSFSGKTSTPMNNDTILEGFRMVLVKTFGHYERFFKNDIEPTGHVVTSFDMDSFLSTRGKAERKFLTAFCQSQMFFQFISERQREYNETQTLPRTQFEADIEREVPKESGLQMMSNMVQDTLQSKWRVYRSKTAKSPAPSHSPPIFSSSQLVNEKTRSTSVNSTSPSMTPNDRHAPPSKPAPPPPTPASVPSNKPTQGGDVEHIFSTADPLQCKFEEVHARCAPPAATKPAAEGLMDLLFGNATPAAPVSSTTTTSKPSMDFFNTLTATTEQQPPPPPRPPKPEAPPRPPKPVDLLDGFGPSPQSTSSTASKPIMDDFFNMSATPSSSSTSTSPATTSEHFDPFGLHTTAVAAASGAVAGVAAPVPMSRGNVTPTRTISAPSITSSMLTIQPPTPSSGFFAASAIITKSPSPTPAVKQQQQAAPVIQQPQQSSLMDDFFAPSKHVPPLTPPTSVPIGRLPPPPVAKTGQAMPSIAPRNLISFDSPPPAGLHSVSCGSLAPAKPQIQQQPQPGTLSFVDLLSSLNNPSK